MIKFYCHDHKALLCSVCVTLQHTSTSCKVNYIPDISCQIINSKEHQDILKAMNTITEQCRTKLEEMKKMTSKSNISLIDVLAGIKKFRKEISQRLDELERKAEDAANAIQQENNKNLDKVEAACDDKTKSLKKASDSIKHLYTSNQADRLFLELKLAEKMIKAYEKSIHSLNTYDLREFSFQPNIAILLSLKSEKSLGTLTHKSLNMQSRQALHKGNICVKTPKEECVCAITGMILLTTDQLIICDAYNHSLKLVDTSNYCITGYLKLDCTPLDVTAVTKTEVAVLSASRIQFVSVSSNSFKKKHTLKTGGNGLSCYQGRLVVVVARGNSWGLEILDINDTISTTVRVIKTNSPSICFVTACYSGIYVSCCSKKTVAKLNWNGEVIDSFGDMDNPSRITQSDDGTIFVKDGDVLRRISGDCLKENVVLQNSENFEGFCCDSAKNTLYTSTIFGDEKVDNYLQIYRIV
ncbi:uncharacterized protein LOC128553204 [Mercenaria mercenaria]|uniref:uncharacterized protein LOC128553204 n=1 Tax=Mercenaria mercenaria TaxID=6596 RepID=UPI00234E8FA1|nr:uncharacterized protein LOC128553204 [Mercenaria mercenaria]XP_053390301.1 uncharacterized protein LOC128553204 [Mercenaria mercenaria]